MLNALKQRLRDWLLDDPTDFTLIAKVEGEDRTLKATRTAGVFLICSAGADQELLVSENQAQDSRRFRTLWRRLGGLKSAKWEDGSPVDLADFSS